MIGILIAVAGALLLISAGKGRRVAAQPVRINNRKR
jgi:hypothetical protein